MRWVGDELAPGTPRKSLPGLHKLAYPERSLHTCVTTKQTAKPMASGMKVATDVHFALRVSL